MEKVVGYLLIVNAVLAALSMALHKLVDVFPSLAAADSIAGKIVAAVQKIVDFASANIAHKPAPAPEAAKAVEAPKA